MTLPCPTFLMVQDAMARELAAFFADEYAAASTREETLFPTVSALHQHTARELRKLTRQPITIRDGDWIYTTDGDAVDGLLSCENLRLPGVGRGRDYEAASLDLLDQQNDF